MNSVNELFTFLSDRKHAHSIARYPKSQAITAFGLRSRIISSVPVPDIYTAPWVQILLVWISEISKKDTICSILHTIYNDETMISLICNISFKMLWALNVLDGIQDG